MNAGSDVELSVEVNQTPSRLRLGLSVRNAGRERIFVRLIATNAAHAPLPELAYTACREEGLLHVLIGEPPQPPGGPDLYAPVMPLARGVAPGESAGTDVVLDVPVEEWQPYAPLPEEAQGDEGSAEPGGQGDSEPLQEETSVTRILVSLEYVLERNISAHSRRDDYPEGFYRVVGTPVEVVQETVDLASPLAVLRRTDDYPRF
jgi:hypothetical protein